LVTAAAGGGDEGMLWDLVSPPASRWLATATVLALILPPLWACWRALVPRRRPLVLFAALMVTMLPILGVPALDRAIYGDWIAGARPLPAWFGVPHSVWWVEAGVVLALLALRRALRGVPPR
jgi:hypothetical protein